MKHNDGFVTLVEVDVSHYLKNADTVKKTLTIPKWANDMGTRLGVNFSKLLTEKISELI